MTQRAGKGTGCAGPTPLRRCVLHAVAFLCAIACSAFAGSDLVLEALLKKNATAIGAGRLKRISSARQVQLYRSDAGEVIQILYAKKPNRLRIETLTLEGRIIQGFDGDKGWCRVQRVRGPLQTIDLSPEEDSRLRKVAAAAFIDTTDGLLLAGAQGAHIGLREASPDANGKILLNVESPEGEKYHLKIDAASGLVAARYSSSAGKALHQLYSDYKEIDGIAIPLKTTLFVDGKETSRVNVCGIQYDVDLDDALFMAPGDAQAWSTTDAPRLTSAISSRATAQP